jgi:hypothetical protein
MMRNVTSYLDGTEHFSNVRSSVLGRRGIHRLKPNYSSSMPSATPEAGQGPELDRFRHD